jgi:hypothetical protein
MEQCKGEGDQSILKFDKVFGARNLKGLDKFTPLNKEKEKRKSSFFIAMIVCFPEVRR